MKNKALGSIALIPFALAALLTGCTINIPGPVADDKPSVSDPATPAEDTVPEPTAPTGADFDQAKVAQWLDLVQSQDGDLYGFTETEAVEVVALGCEMLDVKSPVEDILYTIMDDNPSADPYGIGFILGSGAAVFCGDNVAYLQDELERLGGA